MASAVGGRLECLQGLLGSSLAPAGPVVRGPGQVVLVAGACGMRTHSATGRNFKCLFSGSSLLQTHIVVGARPIEKARPTVGTVAAMRALAVGVHYWGCWILPWAHSIGGWCWESDCRHAGAQLDKRVADEPHGTGQSQETGSVCTSVAARSCHVCMCISGG